MGETRKWVKRLVVLVVVAWLKTRWWRGKAARIQRGAAACWGVFQPPATGRACSRLLLGCRGSEARLRCCLVVFSWAAGLLCRKGRVREWGRKEEKEKEGGEVTARSCERLGFRGFLYTVPLFYFIFFKLLLLLFGLFVYLLLLLLFFFISVYFSCETQLRAFVGSHILVK